jgi:hypothetical protein
VSSSTDNSEPKPKEPKPKDHKGLARLRGKFARGEKKAETPQPAQDTAKRFQNFFERT